MKIPEYIQTFVWSLCLGLLAMGTPEIHAEKIPISCTPQVQVCLSLASHFVDADNPLKKTSITHLQALSKDYKLVELLAAKKGVFVVEAKTGKHYLTVALLSGGMWWKLERVFQDSIVLTEHDEYGKIYQKVKYFFDLHEKKVFPAQELKEVKVDRATVYKNELLMIGTTRSRARQGEKSVVIRVLGRKKSKGPYDHDLVREVNHAFFEPILAVREGQGVLQLTSKQFHYSYDGVKWTRVSLTKTKKERSTKISAESLGFPNLQLHIPLAVAEENLLVVPGPKSQERRFLVWNHKLTSDIRTGVKVRRENLTEFFPLPQPDQELFETFRPTRSGGYPHSMATTIGPFQFHKNKIWFGLAFPDAEGESGVGGYGVFDTGTLEYRIHYRPEWAQWAASAFWVKGGTMWVGLFRQGERSVNSAGVVQFHPQTGSSWHIGIPEMVYVIQEWQGTVFFGTSNGVWILDGNTLIPGYFTVNRSGRYQLKWEKAIAVPKLGKRPSPD